MCGMRGMCWRSLYSVRTLIENNKNLRAYLQARHAKKQGNYKRGLGQVRGPIGKKKEGNRIGLHQPLLLILQPCAR